MAKHRVTDASIRSQILAARERETASRLWEPRAQAAAYDAATERIAVDLTNGAHIAIPLACMPELRGAPIEDVAAVEVSPSGEGLHWERLDADYSVPDLMLVLIGPRAWRSALGRAAGRVSTPRKRRAARKNGAKGGRPRAKRQSA